MNPVLICLDFELTTRQPDKPLSIFHMFYDAISKATQQPNRRHGSDLPLIDQSNWLMLNWKSLGSCKELMVSHEFEHAIAQYSNCIVFVAEGIAFVSDIVRRAIRIFLQQKFLAGKPVLFLLANRMVEILRKNHRCVVEESLNALAIEVILDKEASRTVVKTKACRMQKKFINKDVRDGLEWLWRTTGTFQTSQTVLPHSEHDLACACPQKTVFDFNQEKCVKKRGKNWKSLYKVKSEGFILTEHGCKVDYLSERSKSLNDLTVPDFSLELPVKPDREEGRTTVLKMDFPKRDAGSKRKCSRDLYEAQKKLRRAIRLNTALQNYLFKEEQESEDLGMQKTLLTSSLVSVPSLRDKLPRILRGEFIDIHLAESFNAVTRSWLKHLPHTNGKFGTGGVSMCDPVRKCVTQ